MHALYMSLQLLLGTAVYYWAQVAAKQPGVAGLYGGHGAGQHI
jgi:hypothetical protein